MFWPRTRKWFLFFSSLDSRNIQEYGTSVGFYGNFFLSSLSLPRGVRSSWEIFLHLRSHKFAPEQLLSRDCEIKVWAWVRALMTSHSSHPFLCTSDAVPPLWDGVSRGGMGSSPDTFHQTEERGEEKRREVTVRQRQLRPQHHLDVREEKTRARCDWPFINFDNSTKLTQVIIGFLNHQLLYFVIKYFARVCSKISRNNYTYCTRMLSEYTI